MVTTFLFSRVTGLRDVTVSFKQTDLCVHVTDFNVPQHERIPCYEEVLLVQSDSYMKRPLSTPTPPQKQKTD